MWLVVVVGGEMQLGKISGVGGSGGGVDCKLIGIWI